MLVSEVKIITSGASCELQASVRSDATGKPFLLRYLFPPGYERFISVENGDPFLAALLLPAMKSHEPLEIAASISPKLDHSVDAIQRIYKSWDQTLSKVNIKAPVCKASSSAHNHSRHALFFSCGVDSYYSLLKNLQNHPIGKEAITDLVVVHGFDIAFGRRNTRMFDTLLANSKKVGREFHKNVLPVATNLRDFGDRFINWRALYFGAFLASIGLALESVFDRVYVASAHSYAQIAQRDRAGMIEGSHPDLDPLWSTERVSFVHDGCEATRLEKIGFITKFPIALQTLRVCIIDSYGGGLYNCGSCHKCLRTMIALHIIGALQKCSTLPNSIDLGRLSNTWISDPNARDMLQTLVRHLGSSETDLAIGSALEQVLSEKSRARRHFLGTTTYLLSLYTPFLLRPWNRVQHFTTRSRPRTK